MEKKSGSIEKKRQPFLLLETSAPLFHYPIDYVQKTEVSASQEETKTK